MLRSTAWWVRSGRLGFALLASVALVAQLLQSLEARRSTVDFFSYFTIQSNLIGVAVLTWVALRPTWREGSVERDLLRGAPVLYLGVTGVVFALLLSGQPLVTVPFANTVLHELMPLVVVVDWLADPPGRLGTFTEAAGWWMIYPVAWLAYTMIRGAIVGWYPYPFLDPGVMGGYGGVTAVVSGIVVGALGFIVVLVWLGRWMRLRVGS